MTSQDNPDLRSPTSAGIGSIDSVRYAIYRKHVLDQIAASQLGTHPFYHSYIENILPQELYDSLLGYMLDVKYQGRFEERKQDNPAYVNRRHRLVGSTHEAVQYIVAIFSDSLVKQELLARFYKPAAVSSLINLVEIHDEFEFTFTSAHRFQNIHIDIPPKYLSFVFYLPTQPLDSADEKSNATILYDRGLNPQYIAYYRRNSVCVFAPHFYSYHGFSSTIERDAMVMFYVDSASVVKWNSDRRKGLDVKPYGYIREVVEAKLRKYPLIEIDLDGESMAHARQTCLVNAPNGRVLIGRDDRGVSARRLLPRWLDRAALKYKKGCSA